MLYMFVGLAVVCDDYFENSLAEISEYLGLSDDVAGATFMAAGSSAPELFTSVMGVFVAESDVGIGTIVGSAVFNVLIIIGAVALTAVNPTGGLVRLQWYPLTRDSIFYCLTIVLLVVVVFDGEVNIAESVACLVMYILYIVIMKFNVKMEKATQKMVANAPNRHCPLEKQVMCVCDSAYMQIFIMACILGNVVILFLEIDDGIEPEILDTINLAFSCIFIAEMVIKIYGMGFFAYWRDPANTFDGILVCLIIGEFMLKAGTAGGSDVSALRAVRMFRIFKFLRGLRIFKLCVGSSGTLIKTGSLNRQNRVAPISGEEEIDRELAMAKAASGEPEGEESKDTAATTKDLETGDKLVLKPLETKEETKEDEEKKIDDEGEKEKEKEAGGDDEEEEDYSNPFEVPDGIGSKIYWVVTFPLCVIMWATVPGPHWGPKYKKYFFLTFTMSIVWIGALSFIMVWMAELFGKAAGIPPPVMGLTILAAGTSIPDTIASVNVGKAGKGDMAVSNSIGSNVFDILIGLGVPWFIKTVCMSTTVIIQSDGIVFNIMILFITVAIVVLCIHLSAWMLTRKVGYFLLFVYLLFVVQSLLTEYKYILAPGCPNNLF